MEWIEVLCKCKKDGTPYRRLVRRSSIRGVVENSDMHEVYLIFEVKKFLFWRKRQYLIVVESFDAVKEKLLPLQKQR